MLKRFLWILQVWFSVFCLFFVISQINKYKSVIDMHEIISYFWIFDLFDLQLHLTLLILCLLFSSRLAFPQCRTFFMAGQVFPLFSGILQSLLLKDLISLISLRHFVTQQFPRSLEVPYFQTRSYKLKFLPIKLWSHCPSSFLSPQSIDDPLHRSSMSVHRSSKAWLHCYQKW